MSNRSLFCYVPPKTIIIPTSSVLNPKSSREEDHENLPPVLKFPVHEYYRVRRTDLKPLGEGDNTRRFTDSPITPLFLVNNMRGTAEIDAPKNEIRIMIFF